MSRETPGGNGRPDGPPIENFKVLPVTLLSAGIGDGSEPDGRVVGRVMVLTLAGPDDGTYPLAMDLAEAARLHHTIEGLLTRELGIDSPAY